MRIFGSKRYAKRTSRTGKKLDPRSESFTFLGYSINHLHMFIVHYADVVIGSTRTINLFKNDL